MENFRVADIILDLMIEFYERHPQGKINKIYLGTRDLKEMGLSENSPTLFRIPVQIVRKRSYISLDTNG